MKYTTAYFSSTFCLKFSLLNRKYVTSNLESFAIFINPLYQWCSKTFVTFDHLFLTMHCTELCSAMILPLWKATDDSQD